MPVRLSAEPQPGFGLRQPATGDPRLVAWANVREFMTVAFATPAHDTLILASEPSNLGLGRVAICASVIRVGLFGTDRHTDELWLTGHFGEDVSYVMGVEGKGWADPDPYGRYVSLVAVPHERGAGLMSLNALVAQHQSQITNTRGDVLPFDPNEAVNDGANINAVLLRAAITSVAGDVAV